MIIPNISGRQKERRLDIEGNSRINNFSDKSEPIDFGIKELKLTRTSIYGSPKRSTNKGKLRKFL